MNLKRQSNLAIMMAMMADAMAQNATLETPHIMHEKYVPRIHTPKHKGTSIRVDVRTTPKVGVNELCPCGSGKKNKKCCKLSRLTKKETHEDIQA